MNVATIEQYIPKILLPTARYCYCVYQQYNTIYQSRKYKSRGVKSHTIKNILIYHKSLLSFGGTEKNLQIIAKYLDKERYNIFVMYGTNEITFGNYTKPIMENRKEYVNQGGAITWIPFGYDTAKTTHPYILQGVSPRIEDTIKFYNIDCVITAGAGNAEFPLTDIRVPTIFLNIFGIPNIIPKIKKHICISELVDKMIQDIVPAKKRQVLYIPSEGPFSDSQQKGKQRRQELGLSDNDVIFGRLGRSDATIYDPIGLLAFNSIVRDHPHLYYAIVSPAPQVINFIKENNTPNIICIDPISDESKIRAFHCMIDVLAHFRKDGETCGLNIAESMLCGNPIITHVSRTRNGHLEYLNSENSFVADIDNYQQYADYMLRFANDSDRSLMQSMSKHALSTGYHCFHIDSYMKHFDNILSKIFNE